MPKSFKRFPWIRQHDTMQCGAACLSMVAKYFGLNYPLRFIDELCDTSSQGISLHALQMVAKELGFETMTVKIDVLQLKDVDLPAIIHWRQNHFVVLYKISGNGKYYYISDPGKGKYRLTRDEFLENWAVRIEDSTNPKGVVMMLEPTEASYETYNIKSADFTSSDRKSVSSVIGFHLRRFKKELLQVVLGMMMGVVFQLLFPFLTQAIVDKGILNNNINIIYLILVGECVIVLARTITDFIRRWLLYHVSTRINISMLTAFIEKLFKLPMRFFDSRHLGDFIQRMDDHRRIQDFMTSQLLNLSFTGLSILVFGTALAIYNIGLFFVFLVFSLMYVGWVCIFLHRRKNLDYESFSAQGANQTCTYQLLSTMQETKIQGCSKRRLWEWEESQADLFDVKVKSMRLQQTQEAGTVFINEIKNILITVLAASAVMNGSLTLGGMLAIEFIIGQLTSPVSQIVSFIYSMQDLKISFERVNEVGSMKNEDTDEVLVATQLRENIKFKDISFRYNRFDQSYTLKDINLTFNVGEVTAIVGLSGSGKTSLIKLLLGYYRPTEGEILIDGENLNAYSLDKWRNLCGVVLQEGIIYNDTIVGNIVMGDGRVDKARLNEAMRIAGISEYVNSLPLKHSTKIGNNGKGLSTGQKQRILIARAVYKNPDILIFDEATNSLDTIVENRIVKNLKEFYKDKTVIIIAHRLSTVKDADKIVVLEDGKIVETGTYEELLEKKSAFFDLVRNQIY